MLFMSRNVRKEHNVTFDESQKNKFLNYLNISISCILCSKLDQFLFCSGGIYFLQVEIQVNGQYYHNENHQWLLQLAPFVFVGYHLLMSEVYQLIMVFNRYQIQLEPMELTKYISTVASAIFQGLSGGHSDVCIFNQALNLVISTQLKGAFKYHLLDLMVGIQSAISISARSTPPIDLLYSCTAVGQSISIYVLLLLFHLLTLLRESESQ